MNKGASAAQFASTHWSVVLAARGGGPEARLALERLCRTYWYPLYAFVRRQGHGPDDAQDLTQSFFAWLLQRDQLALADPQLGKFRSFLLGRLKNFLSDARKKAGAQKRGGGQVVISLDAEAAEGRYQCEPITELTPDKIFERRWALTILDRTVASLRYEYVASGRTRLFEELKFFQPGEESVRSYAETAARLGLTEGAVKSAIYRLRQRHRELLRAEIAETVGSEVELDEEILHLIEAVSG